MENKETKKQKNRKTKEQAVSQFFSFLVFKFKRSEKGFTLIEIIVAIGIFSLVVTAVTGIAVSVSKAQRKAIAIQNTQDNLRFALEFMSREMRTGTDFNQLDTINKSDINFKNQSGEDIFYRFIGDKIVRSGDGGLNFADFISGDVFVKNLKFYLNGQAVGDGIQTFVTVAMSLKSKGVFVVTSNVQISVTPRAIDK